MNKSLVVSKIVRIFAAKREKYENETCTISDSGDVFAID